MAKTETTEAVEDKPVTFVIRDADGKDAGEQTLPSNLAPFLLPGQTAELKEEKTKAAAKAAAPSE